MDVLRMVGLDAYMLLRYHVVCYKYVRNPSFQVQFHVLWLSFLSTNYLRININLNYYEILLSSSIWTLPYSFKFYLTVFYLFFNIPPVVLFCFVLSCLVFSYCLKKSCLALSSYLLLSHKMPFINLSLSTFIPTTLLPVLSSVM